MVCFKCYPSNWSRQVCTQLTGKIRDTGDKEKKANAKLFLGSRDCVGVRCNCILRPNAVFDWSIRLKIIDVLSDLQTILLELKLAFQVIWTCSSGFKEFCHRAQQDGKDSGSTPDCPGWISESSLLSCPCCFRVSFNDVQCTQIYHLMISIFAMPKCTRQEKNTEKLMDRGVIALNGYTAFLESVRF